MFGLKQLYFLITPSSTPNQIHPWWLGSLGRYSRILFKSTFWQSLDGDPSRDGVLIVQKWKHFVAIRIAGGRAATLVS